MKTTLAPITLISVLMIPSASFAAPIFFDLRAPEIEDVDEANSFSLTEDGLTATLTALPSTFNEPPLRDLFLNRTASSFGINVVDTTCGGMEEASQIDGGCTGESVQIVFDRDVILRNLMVSIFGSLDEGRIDITGASSIDITSTGLQSLGDVFLAAGSPFSVVYVAGNGFSFDNFTVELVPEPGVVAFLAIGFGGLIAHRRRSV